MLWVSSGLADVGALDAEFAKNFDVDSELRTASSTLKGLKPQQIDNCVSHCQKLRAAQSTHRGYPDQGHRA